MIGIYIHIPFCLRKCDYCDFFSLPVEKESVPHQAYLAALRQQLDGDIDGLGLDGRPVFAVYFGGGTPSLMPCSFFQRMLSALRERFALDHGAEVSCEVNPATVGSSWFRDAKAAGINRVSIGIQSFQPHLLNTLGRLHSAEDAMHAITWARQAGLANISVDFMFGIPGQTKADLKKDLQTAMTFGPQHICVYQLTIERGTPLERRLERSCRKPGENRDALPEDEILEQMREARQVLSGGGWRRYEISNYARLGFECRHNLNYWRYGQYLGLGPGATSFLRTNVPTCQRTVFGRRWTQARDLSAYLDGRFEIVDAEDIDLPTAMAEFCFLGLRTSEGISPAEFEQLFGVSFNSVYGHRHAGFIADGLLREEAGRLRLTPRGVELSNQVFTSFIHLNKQSFLPRST